MNTTPAPAPTSSDPDAAPTLPDEALLRQHDITGPRYTSYPTAPQFSSAFAASDLHAAFERSRAADRSLSLYFHLPFCESLCYYCACNKIVTRKRTQMRQYLDLLARELEMKSALCQHDRPITQLHWGGGSPTFLTPEEMTELMFITARLFRIPRHDQAELSIEIDPRHVDADRVALLRGLGFNRLSLGIQDFDADVQTSINRVQSVEQVRTVMDAARAHGFHSIGFDLIYGLPRQTLPGFRRTLKQVIELAPDRLSLFNYAHLPERFPSQRLLDASALPPAAVKIALIEQSRKMLHDAGYIDIGMDHFARPDDALSMAQQQGTLKRNFQGYSTCAESDLIGFGITAISDIGDTYSQNARTIQAYAETLENGQLPVERGVALSHDDRLRRAVIMGLLCHLQLDIRALEQRWHITFSDYFSNELVALQPFLQAGWLQLSDDSLVLTSAGRPFVRRICMLFDRYLGAAATAPGNGKPVTYSRVL